MCQTLSFILTIFLAIQNIYAESYYKNNLSEDKVKNLLQKQDYGLHQDVINKVTRIIQCANKHNIERNNILTIIDYSKPSNQKRFWVFDLEKQKLLFYTYVSHGITSGTLMTDSFSNVNNTKASSIGVYKTGDAYRGREGLSMKLDGLDESFNDNAFKRFIVMHGGWYMDEKFIKRYGRPGRSWGCPAVPLHLQKNIIDTIKDNSLMVIYYPNDKWFNNSKFLNCENLQLDNKILTKPIKQPILVENDKRDSIIYLDLDKNDTQDKTDPIIAMSADDYETVFKKQAPLSRMLRRQLKGQEFIALSDKEFYSLVLSKDKNGLNKIKFIVAVVYKKNGRNRTKMEIVNFGNIKNINIYNKEISNSMQASYIEFDLKAELVNLKTSNHFIRWIGV